MKKPSPNKDELLADLIRFHVPESYLEFFDLYKVHNKKDCWEFELHEKESLVPVGLSGKETVLDGFCNPVSILGHSFSLKKVFLIMKRRRWKEAGTDKHLTNNYEFEPHSAKMTNEMAAFLKGIH
jgi:hypothetical protein